jgi:hypothetical protein
MSDLTILVRLRASRALYWLLVDFVSARGLENSNKIMRKNFKAVFSQYRDYLKSIFLYCFRSVSLVRLSECLLVIFEGIILKLE